MSNAPVVTLSAIGVTPTRPSTKLSSVPVKPGVTSKSTLPLALAAPCTSVGAATATGRRAIGLRTRWVPSHQMSDPFAHSPSVAVVRVKWIVNVAAWPGASVSEAGVTVVSIPSRLTDAP